MFRRKKKTEMFGRKKKTEAEIRAEIEEAVTAEIRMNVVCEIGGTYRGYLSDGTMYVVTVDQPELSEVDLTWTRFEIDLSA